MIWNYKRMYIHTYIRIMYTLDTYVYINHIAIDVRMYIRTYMIRRYVRT